uniref:Uncharacterized protein n=1 Tax=Panagrolaimus sp. PS1159 TaxID=55785 RepID=A0AC35EYU2_9BILA
MSEWSTVVTDTDILRCTKKFPTYGNKPVYDFKKCIETENDFKGHCRCCANCKYESNAPMNNQQTFMIEQLMIMDFKLSVVKEEALGSEDEAFYVLFFYPAWQAGKWKTNVRTRLCQKCINELIEKTDQAYEAVKVIEEATNVEAEKRQRQNDVEVEVHDNVAIQKPSSNALENTNLNNSDPRFVAETIPS